MRRVDSGGPLRPSALERDVEVRGPVAPRPRVHVEAKPEHHTLGNDGRAATAKGQQESARALGGTGDSNPLFRQHTLGVLETPPHVAALAESVRATLARGETYDVRLSELIESNLGATATDVGKRLAKKWIKNAANHVFDDPHRWIVELVVNAIDASRAVKVSAGQFGIGFLSALEFLAHPETAGTRIEIQTRTVEGTYRITLTGDAVDPRVQMTHLRNGGHDTGTMVRVIPNKGRFSYATLEGLTRQLHLLQFNANARVDLVPPGTQQPVRIGAPGARPDVRVAVKADVIAIEDFGTGITPEVATTKLLIPSGSTKTRAPVATDGPVDLPELVTWKGKVQPELSYALIEVAGVVVVAHEIRPTVRGTDGKATDVLLRMPSWTRITLDRDQIILDSNGGSPEEAALRRMIDGMLERTFADLPERELHAAALTLSGLHASLAAWERTSASAYMARRPLTGYLREELQKRLADDPSRIPVSVESFAALSRIVQGLKPLPLPAALVDYDYGRAEVEIPELLGYESNLIDGKCIVFVDDAVLPRISALGLRQTLFVPASLRVGDADAIAHRIINGHAEGFARLTRARTNATSSFGRVADLMLVTNFSHKYEMSSKADIIRQEYAERQLFGPEHRDALLAFWSELAQSHVKFGVLNRHNRYAFVRDLVLDFRYGDGSDTSLLDAFTVLPDGSLVTVDNDAMLAAYARHLETCAGDKESAVEALVRDGGPWSERHDPVPFVDVLFQSALGYLGYGAPDHARIVRLGDRQIWPLPENATADDLAILYTALIEHQHSFRAGPCPELPGYHLDIVRELQDANRSFSGDLIRVVTPMAASLATSGRDLAQIAAAEKALKPVVSNLRAFDRAVTSVGLCRGLEVDTKARPALRSLARGLEQAFVHLSIAQLQLPDGAVAGGYDRQRLNAVPLRDSDVGVLHRMLVEWPDDVTLGKLFAFQREHAADVLGDERRAWDLQACQLSSYALNADFTPFGYLTVLRGAHPSYLATLVDACSTANELLFATRIMHSIIATRPWLLKEADSVTSSAISDFIKKLIHERVDPSQIRDFRIRLQYHGDGDNPVLGAFAGELGSQLELARRQSQAVMRASLRDERLDATLRRAPAFRLSQLLAAQVASPAMADILSRGDLDGAVALARSQTVVADTNKIRQNIENGSERSAVQASLIEPVQNALDAIRSVAREAEHRVDLAVDLVAAADGQASLALEIGDTAGMPSLGVLLTDFILPDYSNKADAGGAVGVMGNGLFQLYADAAEVVMTTRLTGDANKVYALRAVPVRENGRVVDLDLHCADVSQAVDPSFVGSTLQVVMRPRAPGEASYDRVWARAFVHDTLVAAHSADARGQAIPIYLDGTHVNAANEDVIAERNGIRARRYGEPRATSQLTTGGIPVVELARFCREHALLPENFLPFLQQGIAIDLPLGSYTPLQSRTDLKLPPETREALRATLLDAVWTSVFESSRGRGELGTVFQHLTSHATDLAQVMVRPDPAIEVRIRDAVAARQPFNVVAFMTHYSGQVAESFASFTEKVNRAAGGADDELRRLSDAYRKEAERLGDDATHERVMRAISSTGRQVKESVEASRQRAIASVRAGVSDERTRAMVEAAVIPWIDNKLVGAVDTELRGCASRLEQRAQARRRASPSAPPRTVSQLLWSKPTQKIDAATEARGVQLAERVAASLNAYCAAVATHAPHARAKAPPAVFFDADTRSPAYYQRSQNRIGMGVGAYPPSRIAEELVQLAHHGEIKAGSLLERLFLVSPASAGTVNHELAHWRQGSDTNAHDPGVTPDGQTVDFESWATSHWRTFAQAGGLTAWIASIRESWSQSAEADIQALQQVEAFSDRAQLQKLFARGA